MYKKVTIINEEDVVFGCENLMVAIEKGMIRRVSRVFVFDTKGSVLLQKRSSKVLARIC